MLQRRIINCQRQCCIFVSVTTCLLVSWNRSFSTKDINVSISFELLFGGVHNDCFSGGLSIAKGLLVLFVHVFYILFYLKNLLVIWFAFIVCYLEKESHWTDRKMKRKRWKIGEKMFYLIRTRTRLCSYKTKGIGSLLLKNKHIVKKPMSRLKGVPL